MYPDIKNARRKTYLGMVTAMDDVLKNLVDDLKAQNMYENSIIVFSSDNGGLTQSGLIEYGASNEPLRGQKTELYEGGIRVPGFIHSSQYVKQPGYSFNNFSTFDLQLLALLHFSLVSECN